MVNGPVVTTCARPPAIWRSDGGNRNRLSRVSLISIWEQDLELGCGTRVLMVQNILTTEQISVAMRGGIPHDGLQLNESSLHQDNKAAGRPQNATSYT